MRPEIRNTRITRTHDGLTEMLSLDQNGDIPNNPDLPVVIYRHVLPPDSDLCSITFEHHFIDNGWHGIWRAGIYDYHHFHSKAHEVLGIIAGTCRIQLGGMAGKIITLTSGDMLVLPAGTGHKDAGSSDDLIVIGAYPLGQTMDICRSAKDMPYIKGVIQRTPLPVADPFYGDHGLLVRLWSDD